jgi:anaerobic magnesium-protoporphyrin IX monomethyl ester cyclase
MKILFLLKETIVMERMGMMYLIGSLKAHGKEVDLLVTGSLRPNAILSKVAEIRPSIIAVSAMTGEHNYYLSLLAFLKKHLEFFSVMGGPHATFSPEVVQNKCLDAACIGEGEEALVDLTNALQNGDPIEAIPNFSVFSDGRLKVNPPRPLVDNLDELPFPDRELLYSKDRLLQRDRIKTFFTIRGCPYHCTYCFNDTFNKMYQHKGKVIRTRSVDNFIEEVNQVRRAYPTELLSIYDDNFLLHDIEWLEEFAAKIPREVGLPFIVNFIPNLATEEKIALLKKAGVSYIEMALETADEDVNRNILNRVPTQEDIMNAARILHKYNIKFQVDCLIGLPVKDPLKNALRTLDFEVKLRPTFALANILYPYPKTPIYQYVVEKGFYSPRDAGSLEKDFTRNYSVLTFRDPKVRKKLSRLHKLWGITVSHPLILRKLIPLLICLPLLKFYTYIFWAWHGLSYRFRLAVTSSSFRDLPHYIWRLFSFLGGIEKYEEEC